MKKLAFALMMVAGFTSCDSDDDGVDTPDFEGETKEYTLNEMSDSGVSGTVTFMENEDGSATVEFDLEGTPNDGMHPAHIHMGTAAETGDIAVTFTHIDGATGMSTTEVSALDDGTDITYEELVSYDGYINVHLSAEELGTIVAQTDIGENELTGESKTYELGEKAVEGISGSVIFEERMSGEALATIMLDGTPVDGMHPAHIHMGTAAEGPGDITFTFNPVNGATGMSMTNVAMLDDDETEFGYEDVLNYDGYVNVHLSADDLDTLVAQGDIGQNELTGESASYDLESVDVEGIMGTAMFEERVNGETLVTIMLDGTPADGMHPAHIHEGSVADAPGDIAISLNSVNGATGMSATNVTKFDGEDGEMIDYNSLLEYDGYLNVHLSADDLGTLVAQGNVGSNS